MMEEMIGILHQSERQLIRNSKLQVLFEQKKLFEERFGQSKNCQKLVQPSLDHEVGSLQQMVKSTMKMIEHMSHEI